MKLRWLIITLLVTVIFPEANPKRNRGILPLGELLQEGGPLIIAHRGASSLAPENTLAAIEAALHLNVDIIEVDVHHSREGIPVVLHDKTVNRTTNGSGGVRRFTVKELKELDAGSWFGPGYEGERIPTLEEVLKAVQGRAILLIELKSKNAETSIVELIEKLGMSGQVIIQSFEPSWLRRVKQIAPELETMLLVNKKKEPGVIVEKAKEIGAASISVNQSLFSNALLTQAAASNLKLFVWTVDTDYRLRKYITSGIQGIVTNRPQSLLQSQL